MRRVWSAAVLAALALFLAGCAAFSGRPPSGGAAASGLDAKAFDALPGPAKAYLETLARAWETQNEAFLLAQGEPAYEEALRRTTGKSRYLALLYRAGPYAGHGGRDYGPFELDASRVKGIRFLSCLESGPVFLIECGLAVKDGGNVPCVIALLWRLPDIKILGAYP